MLASLQSEPAQLTVLVRIPDSCAFWQSQIARPMKLYSEDFRTYVRDMQLSGSRTNTVLDVMTRPSTVVLTGRLEGLSQTLRSD